MKRLLRQRCFTPGGPLQNMMPMFDLVLACLALIGHLGLWVGIFNRLHATALSCREIRWLEKIVFLAIGILPVLFTWRWLATGELILAQESFLPQLELTLTYLVPCWAMAITVVPLWLYRKLTPQAPPALLSNHTTTLDLAARCAETPVKGLRTRLLYKVPGNQILQLHIQHKIIALPRLSAELEGLRIAHLSDLHFTGHLSKEFYQHIVDCTNQLDADLVAITGDIVDKTRYIDWIPETVGRLKSRYGVFSILGNHDKRVADVAHLRSVLNRSGLIDLGGRWTMHQVRNEMILLAGNELPWFGPAADLQHAPPRDADGLPLRILLAHTPDQIQWAQSFDFDLMLAGHTHGGQICFPLIGPLVSPSRFGVRYAAGVFYEEPTLMHVSRGISGLQPIRINCPPELTCLELRRA